MLRTDAPYLGDFDENKKKFEATFKEPRMDTYADLVFLGAGPTPAPNPRTGGRRAPPAAICRASDSRIHDFPQRLSIQNRRHGSPPVPRCLRLDLADLI
jgi:hypothetical protein